MGENGNAAAAPPTLSFPPTQRQSDLSAFYRELQVAEGGTTGLSCRDLEVLLRDSSLLWHIPLPVSRIRSSLSISILPPRLHAVCRSHLAPHLVTAHYLEVRPQPTGARPTVTLSATVTSVDEVQMMADLARGMHGRVRCTASWLMKFVFMEILMCRKLSKILARKQAMISLRWIKFSDSSPWL